MLSALGTTLAAAAIPVSERAALLEFYKYTSPWAHSDGWGGAPGTECTWYGITCDANWQTVVGITLNANHVDGTLPALAALTNLETFDVRNPPLVHASLNSLVGPIPPLNSLKKLRFFNAPQMGFSGSIPDLSGLTSLVYFDVSHNFLTGNIPALDGLTNLQYFDVISNRLTGPIPSLTGLTNLSTFRVTNYLSGPLPPLTGLSRLAVFYAGGTDVTGSIPDLTGLTNLQSFAAGGRLTGSIPSLSGLVNLQFFAVDGNFLTGNIPSLTGLTKLSEFYADSNLLTGNIPSLTGLQNLRYFGVGGDQLTGSIPDLTGLTNLQGIAVGFNQLTGTLPSPPPNYVAGLSGLCPNLLTPASDPPSSIDLAWNTATNTTPWSLNCQPAKWPSYLLFDTSMEPAVAAQPVTLTARIYGMNPTGTVTFTSPRIGYPYDHPVTWCDSVPLVGTEASCTVSLPAGKESDIVATYSGDANNTPSDNTYGGLSFFPEHVEYAYSLTTGTNPAQPNEPVDLVATFTGLDSDVFSGTVSFFGDAFPFDTPDDPNVLCSHVPAIKNGNRQTAHCVASFADLGDNPVNIRGDRDGPYVLILPGAMTQTIVAATAFDADQFALTGSWFNPPTAGQGLEIEVFPDLAGVGTGFLFGGWFTYDANGNQQWVTLQGNLASSHGNAYPLAIAVNTGGVFNAPPTTSATQTGTATLTLYDCTHAALSYSFSDGRTGTIPYVRLTPPVGCSTAVPATTPSPLPPNYNDVLHSGSWFDPATAGQGLIVDIDPAINTFFAAWYTYAPLAENQTGLAAQRWFTIQVNNYTAGNLDIGNAPIIATSGGRFNDATPAKIQQVGTAHITYTSCNTMTLQYSFTQGEFVGLSGTINEQRLGPAVDCQ